MNKVVLIGRLTKEPDLKFLPGSGTAATTITLAVDRYNTKTGQNEADFINVVVYGKQAENLVNYMKKGGQVAISGRLATRSYDAKDGTKRYITEVIADNFGGVKFLTNVRNNNNYNQDYSGSNNYGDPNQDITPVDDGDMPF